MIKNSKRNLVILGAVLCAVVYGTFLVTSSTTVPVREKNAVEKSAVYLRSLKRRLYVLVEKSSSLRQGSFSDGFGNWILKGISSVWGVSSATTTGNSMKLKICCGLCCCAIPEISSAAITMPWYLPPGTVLKRSGSWNRHGAIQEKKVLSVKICSIVQGFSKFNYPALYPLTLRQTFLPRLKR